MYFVTHEVHRILFVENILLPDGMDIDMEDLMLDIVKQPESNKDSINKSDETIYYVNSSEDESGDIENKEDEISGKDGNVKKKKFLVKKGMMKAVQIQWTMNMKVDTIYLK